MTTQTPTPTPAPAPAPKKPLSLRYTARCEIGLVRKNNQDSCYVSPTMLVVADGMGGAAAGDLASAVVIKELRTVDAPHAGQDMCTLLGDAVERATTAIAELVEADSGLDGMGSTVTGLMFDSGEAAVVNIGDSRTYIFRDGVLTRLSHDHSWVQSLVDEGRISEEESLVHPHRSLILRVINGQPQHVPDLGVIDLLAGDRLLICSDGLCGFVTDDVIEQAMVGELDFVLERLTGLAHRQGGLDNITIVVADVVEGPPEGLPQVYGAAALLDLDAPLDKTRKIELVPEDSVFAPQGPPSVHPRPDPAQPEQARYAPTAKPGVGTWVKVLIGLLIPVVVIAAGGWAWYQFTQQQYYVGANGETVAVYRGVPGQVFGYPLSSVVNPDGPKISDLPKHYQQVVRENQTVTSRDQGNAMLANLQTQANKCIQARAGATQTPPPTSPSDPNDPDPSTSPGYSGYPGYPGYPGSGAFSPAYPSAFPSPSSTNTADPMDECE